VWGQGALRKKSTEQRANVRPPRISGLSGALLRQSRPLLDYNITLAKINACFSACPHPHPPVCETYEVIQLGPKII